MAVKSLVYLNHRKKSAGTCWVLTCHNPGGPPHHLKAVGSGRNRKEPMMEHFTLAPDLCGKHHSEYHNIGERKFIEKYGNVWKYALLELAGYLFEEEKRDESEE